MMPTLLKQIRNAQKETRKLKKTNPHLYPQYQELLNAEADLVRAKTRLKAAKEAWAQLGNIIV